ncbi:MAG: hypothetical protein CMO74_10380 [Verrucomicrobiales bacterium]|nr:hypothetical protein [Verrucomicrobiales bacterium]|tara:strand:- start:14835 stop:15908 length:1074 start_codon:yes stop_codon:yes gene_type:complete
MQNWFHEIYDRLTVLEEWGWFTLAFNAVVFVTAPWLAARYGEIKTQASKNSRLRMLHGFNFIVFSAFLLAVIFKAPIPRAVEFSQSLLLVLATYLLIHLTEALLLHKYGREVSVEDFTRRVETQTSKTLELVAVTTLLIIACVVLINIWGFKSWLEATSVLGFIALLFFLTREHWVGDFLSGIMIISAGRIERGDVVRIPGENILGIVLRTRGLHTIIRDLATGHDIQLPNTAILNQRVDVLRTDLERGVRDYVEFKIGYQATADEARDFLTATWKAACERSTAINDGKPCKVTLKECGDHGTTWRLAYTPGNIHNILHCQDTIREAALRLQTKRETISLSTPVTHQEIRESATNAP